MDMDIGFFESLGIVTVINLVIVFPMTFGILYLRDKFIEVREKNKAEGHKK